MKLAALRAWWAIRPWRHQEPRPAVPAIGIRTISRAHVAHLIAGHVVASCRYCAEEHDRPNPEGI